MSVVGEGDEHTELMEAEAAVLEKLPLTPNLAQGSLMKAIWTMSWPIMITTLSSSLVGLADMHVAGFLGSETQAAVGVSEQILFILMIFIMSTGVGTQALVSRATGANEPDEAARVTGQSIVFALLMGLILLVIAKLSAFGLVHTFSRSESVAVVANNYLSIYVLYLIPFSFLNIINSAFRAIGDARTTLIIMLSTTAINIAGDYLTVMHNWPVPGLGVSGIAWSGVIASAVGATIAVNRILNSPLRNATKYIFPFIGSIIKRIIKIG
ncbi:MAG: polysaccharide biosynthesis C-terminal domain-containing protein, partial [Leptolyngbya sp.]|nr:polysaccharide biosynthesis C-terminal domain-containing protein [Candidatus Melainabacteria bacterium]